MRIVAITTLAVRAGSHPSIVRGGLDTPWATRSEPRPADEPPGTCAWYADGV